MQGKDTLPMATVTAVWKAALRNSSTTEASSPKPAIGNSHNKSATFWTSNCLCVHAHTGLRTAKKDSFQRPDIKNFLKWYDSTQQRHLSKTMACCSLQSALNNSADLHTSFLRGFGFKKQPLNLNNFYGWVNLNCYLNFSKKINTWDLQIRLKSSFYY